MTKAQRRHVRSAVRYAVLGVVGADRLLPDLLDGCDLVQARTPSGSPGRRSISPIRRRFANYMNVWFGVEEYAETQYIKSLQKPLVALRNSLVIACSATLLAVAFGAVIAYGVSRYRILSEVRMFQLLMLRMIPPIVFVAPLSLYYSAIGLLDSMFGLILIYFLTSLPYAVWMTKSFIDEVPREIEQAAEILGASRWRTMFEVVLPLIRSGLVATFLFILILTWSEYLLAFIIGKTDAVTLPVELSKYQGTSEGRVYGRQAALAVGITVPLMIDRHPDPQASGARLQLRHGAEITLARIELCNLHKTFGSVVAVKNLNIAIEDGEFVVFVGPSGCGKTTTLRMIAGFEDPTAGEIRIDGRVVNDIEPRDRGLGMVFQSHALFPHKTVAQNIEFGLRMKRCARTRARPARARGRARWCGSATCSTRCRTSARAASRSAWRSPARW